MLAIHLSFHFYCFRYCILLFIIRTVHNALNERDKFSITKRDKFANAFTYILNIISYYVFSIKSGKVSNNVISLQISWSVTLMIDQHYPQCSVKYIHMRMMNLKNVLVFNEIENVLQSSSPF